MIVFGIRIVLRQADVDVALDVLVIAYTLADLNLRYRIPTKLQRFIQIQSHDLIEVMSDLQVYARTIPNICLKSN